ncbi:MAG: DsbA family protein [Alphaproteobacteria bacterium]|nr:DsbA family protein [Alphaproteobacteria bacterium]
MSFHKMFLLSCALFLFPIVSSQANGTSALTSAQKKEVEDIVRELITKKEPEMIIHAAQTVQERMEKETSAKGQKSVEKNLDKIVNDPSSPVGGNPKGDITIVEFFDYSCGYCKMAQQTVEKLLDEDKNIRFVYKELPILGTNSLVASKAGIASMSQNKYVKFHQALMTSKSPLNESSIMEIAKEVGMDTDKLKKDMESEKTGNLIKANLTMAKEIGAQGTPTFIVGGKLFPGAVSLEQMKQAIESARQTKKK